MGLVLRGDAGVDRIDQYLETSNARATARGGAVAAAAAARLGVFLAAIAVARTAFVAAKSALVVAFSDWFAAERAAFVGVGAIYGAMRTALGRPARHPALQAFLPDGLRTMTDAGRSAKPALLQFIANQLASVSAPPWSDAQRSGWAAEIEALRLPLAAAVAAADTAKAAYHMAVGTYGAQAREGLRALVQLKRDLRYMGLTEVEVTEIIPHALRTPSSDSGAAVDVDTAPAVLPAVTSGAAGSSPPAGS
ncbi:MAG TPA: hypothetical protein VG389_03125 [Myxococcota bacterium]|jgi:hypothetical protein|nr:hypothetical protein [Myxococcota bacterium]